MSFLHSIKNSWPGERSRHNRETVVFDNGVKDEPRAKVFFDISIGEWQFLLTRFLTITKVIQARLSRTFK